VPAGRLKQRAAGRADPLRDLAAAARTCHQRSLVDDGCEVLAAGGVGIAGCWRGAQ
jgi:hypothetical protein